MWPLYITFKDLNREILRYCDGNVIFTNPFLMFGKATFDEHWPLYLCICSDAYLGLQVQGSTLTDVLGKVTTFSNWRSSQPSGNGPCVSMYKSDGKWDNIGCSTSCTWTCERALGGETSLLETFMGVIK